MAMLNGLRQLHRDLVGRVNERRLLAEIYEDVRSGSGHLILISGEAGIGKTTLVEQFLLDAQTDDIAILSGSSYDVESPPPYAPWQESLASSVVPLPAAANGSTEWFSDHHLSRLTDQETLFQDVRRRLIAVSRQRPLIIVLEDMHWADRESLEMLRFLARSIREERIGIIVTYRADEVSAGKPLYRTLPHLLREARADRIELRRFSGTAIRQLVSRRYRLSSGDRDRLVDELERRTEGNPLFVVELLRSMELGGIISSNGDSWRVGRLSEAEIPLLVRHLIERRLQLLSNDARSVLQMAAVVGHEVPADLLVAVTGEPVTQLSSCVQQAIDAYLLEQPPGRAHLRFRHALVQETLYTSVPIIQRQSMHRSIGEILTTFPGADPAIIAEHLRLGGDDRAPRWSLQSARHARRLYAPHAVIQQLGHVLEHPETLRPSDHIEALQLRGWAHEIIGAFHEANRDYLAELRTAVESEDRQAERDALVRLAELWTSRDYQRVSEYIERALQITADIDAPLLLARSHNRFGTWYMSQDDPERAREHHSRALEICRQIPGQRGAAETHDLLGLTATLAGDLLNAARHYARARSHFQSMNDLPGIASTEANFAHIGPTYLTDTAVTNISLTECIRAGEQALETASEIDYQTGAIYARIRLTASLGAHGAYQQALDMAERGIEDAERTGNRQLLSAALSMSGLLWIDLFRPDIARQHAERALAISERIGSTFRIRMSAAILTLSLLATDESDEAEARLNEVWAPDMQAHSLAQYLLWRARIELELSRGNPEAALCLLDSLLEFVPHTSRERPAIRLSLLRGRALNGLERYDEAISWLEPALAIAREQAACALTWRIQHELGLACFGAGDRQSASKMFTMARRIVLDLGQTIRDQEMRRAFVRAASSAISEPGGPTPLQAAKMSSGGLTRRQRQVASLVAAGLSNRTIADRFTISERTVESHVSAILSTLGLTSRTQIVAWCLEHGLADEPASPRS